AYFSGATPASSYKLIRMWDAPAQRVPLTYDHGDGVAAGDDAVDKTDMELTFRTDVSAQTLDNRHGGNTSGLTRVAVTGWTANLSGNVDQTTYAWTPAAAAGISVSSPWAAVTDGSRPTASSRRAISVIAADLGDFQ